METDWNFGVERLQHLLQLPSNPHARRTGFLVSKEMKPVIIGFSAINETLCALRVRGKLYNISLVNVHAHTEDSTDEDKDIFFEEVERALDACPR